MDNEFDNILSYKADIVAKEKFSINYLKPFQRLIIQHILEKQNKVTISILPTGGGKSLCFLIPALILDGITIIIYPLLSLMHDQANILKRNNIDYIILEGGMKKNELLFLLNKLNKTKILITNIEMLNIPFIKEKLKYLNISLLVLDEVHTVLSWGQSFRPSYLKTKEIINTLKPKQVIAFSATLTKNDIENLNQLIFNEDAYVINGGFNKENLIYHKIFTLFPLEDIKQVLNQKNHLPAIIFTSSRLKCENLCLELEKYYKCRYYHAGLTKDKRYNLESWFYNCDDGVLISTCAYGMGVDKKNIRCVIHYDLANNASDFIQQSGRAGRDNKISHIYAFIKYNEKSELKFLFFKDDCIREMLINSMNTKFEDICSGCDYCNNSTIEPFAEKFILKFIKYFKIIKIQYLLEKVILIRFLTKKLEKNDVKNAIKWLLAQNIIKKRLFYYVLTNKH